MRFLLPALVTVLALTGCKLNTDYFGEYRDVNLLGNYGFSDVDAQGSPRWALATSKDFMTWEPVTGVPAADGSSPVYRLEIKNLIPNGDFEDATVTADGQTTLPAGWSTTYYNGTLSDPPKLLFGPSPSPTARPGSITGRSLGWEAGRSGDQLRLALSAQVLAGNPQAWGERPYLFRVDAVNVANAAEIGVTLYDEATGQVPTNSLNQNSDWTIKTFKEDGITPDHTSVFSVSRYFNLQPEGGSLPGRIVAFGPNSATGANAAVLDNVRLLPNDAQNLAVRASFSSLSSGVLPLLPGKKKGMYVFTIDVHDDPTAGTLNRFQPTNFSVVVRASVKSGDRELPTTVARPTTGWTGWTTLSYSFGFDFVNSDADLGGQPALSISLSPTVSNTGNVDVGSLLVSRPTLTFNP